MTTLHKHAAFANGVRQELIQQGLSEADASRLYKLAMYRTAYASYPDEFTQGYQDGIDDYVYNKPKKSRKYLYALLAALAGAGGVYAGVKYTKTGNRLAQKLIQMTLGSPEVLKRMNENAVKPLEYSVKPED